MFYDLSACLRGASTGFVLFSIVHFLFSTRISSKNRQEHWRRVNISTSFIHSILSSMMSLYCFIEEPRMCTTNVIDLFTPTAYWFVSFEIGYFLFDMFDLIRKSFGGKSFGVLLHHVIILLCFGIALFYGKYIGYAIMSLAIEVNSIFLHFRQLLLFCDYPRQSKLFRWNHFFNLSTFVIFRFGIIGYMSLWLIKNRFNVPFRLCLIGQSGLFLMTVINVNLLYRLIRSDRRRHRDD